MMKFNMIDTLKRWTERKTNGETSTPLEVPAYTDQHVTKLEAVRRDSTQARSRIGERRRPLGDGGGAHRSRSPSDRRPHRPQILDLRAKVATLTAEEAEAEEAIRTTTALAN